MVDKNPVSGYLSDKAFSYLHDFYSFQEQEGIKIMIPEKKQFL